MTAPASPPQVVVQTAEMGGAGRWQAVLQGMGEEARKLQPGGEAVLSRLADVLVIQTLRHWMQRDPAARTGWLGALQDARIGRTPGAVARAGARARAALPPPLPLPPRTMPP